MEFIPFKKHSYKIKGLFFNKLFISLILLAIVPVSVFFIISCDSYNGTLAKQIKNQSIFMVEQYNKNIESKLSDLINRTNGLLIDENIRTFNATVEELYYNFQKMNILLNIYNKLVTEHRILYKIIDSIYLYYPESNLIISNYGYYDKRVFYDADIIKILENSNISKFDCLLVNRKIKYPESYNSSNRYLGNVLTVIRAIPFSNNRALLVLNIKEEIFLHMSTFDENIASIFLITDENGNEIFSSDALKNKYDHKLRMNALKSIPKTRESGFIIINHAPDVTIFYSGLNKYGLRTLILLPNNYIYTDFSSLKKMIIVIFLSTLGISLAISYFASQKLYNPLRSLLFNIVKKNNTTNEIIKNKNEFGYIEDKYNSVVKQNLEINEKLSENLPLLKELFLKNILEGKINDIKVINNEAKFLGIDIKGAFTFTVYVILIENTEKVLNADNAFELQYLKQTLNKIIRNQLSCKNIEILYTFTDADMLILINWDYQSNNNIIYIPERINSAIKRQINGNINIYISVGLTVNKITDLSYSYTTAIDAINYIGKKSNIIYANDIVHPPKTINYFLPKDEKQLLLSILNCDRKKAIDILNRLINNILEQNISYEYFQQIIIQILNDILKFIEVNGISTTFIGRNPYKEILSIKTIKKTKNWFINQLNEIISYLETNKNDYYSVLVADIINYIHTNYNKDINLEIAARYFSLSRQYFGKIFYEKVGKSFNDYLNTVRLDMSLIYLKETNESVKSIAEKVGFSSSQYYIKLFKDKYGLTPGQYRKKVNSPHNLYVYDQNTKPDYSNSIPTKAV